MALDFLDAGDFNTRSNIGAINTWFITEGVLNDHVINNLILFVVSSNDRVQDVDIYISKDKKEFSFIIYLSRWDLFWHSKTIYRELKSSLSQYLIGKKIKINFDIFKEKNNE